MNGCGWKLRFTTTWVSCGAGTHFLVEPHPARGFGEHGIIDTGIDYTHANFGGPGTVAAFNTAAASSNLPADPTLFGPTAPKVKGGYDLVGDAYNGQNTPVPDPNPLDCSGHGSHVAGTAAGLGVLANGSTFTGPYDLTTPSNQFLIGPGVARGEPRL